MRAGVLDRRILIEQNTPGQDQFGSLTAVWTTFAAVWARVAPATGKEQFLSDQVSGSADTLFRIRFLKDLNIQMRIVYNGENYNIKSILEIARREGMNILATTIEAEDDS